MTGEWTKKRPTAGKWWVAIAPKWRHLFADWTWPVACEVDKRGQLRIRGRWFSFDCEALQDALWLPRETPADPFAGPTPEPSRTMRMELGPRGTAYVTDTGEAISLSVHPDSAGAVFEERLGWLDAAVNAFCVRYQRAGSLEWLLAHEAHPTMAEKEDSHERA